MYTIHAPTPPVTINGCPVYFMRLSQCDNRQTCACAHNCASCAYAQDKGWVPPPHPKWNGHTLADS